jgi:hypothetical protein
MSLGLTCKNQDFRSQVRPAKRRTLRTCEKGGGKVNFPECVVKVRSGEKQTRESSAFAVSTLPSGGLKNGGRALPSHSQALGFVVWKRGLSLLCEGLVEPSQRR